MNKYRSFLVVILVIGVLLCGCENPEVPTSATVMSTPATTNSIPPTTTMPRIPNPSEYDCFSIPDEVLEEVVPWFVGVNGDTEIIQTILKIRSDTTPDLVFYDTVRRMYDPLSNSNLTIEAVLQYPVELVNSYIIIYKDGQFDFATYGDNYWQYVDRTFVPQYEFWKTFYQFALFPEKVLPQDAVIYDICCMRSAGFSVALIGYITDTGEYILYGNTRTGDIYLIPISVYNMIGSQMSWGDVPEDVWDLTLYKIETNE